MYTPTFPHQHAANPESHTHILAVNPKWGYRPKRGVFDGVSLVSESVRPSLFWSRVLLRRPTRRFSIIRTVLNGGPPTFLRDRVRDAVYTRRGLKWGIPAARRPLHRRSQAPDRPHRAGRTRVGKAPPGGAAVRMERAQDALARPDEPHRHRARPPPRARSAPHRPPRN